jgi:hypothetical protein
VPKKSSSLHTKKWQPWKEQPLTMNVAELVKVMILNVVAVVDLEEKC